MVCTIHHVNAVARVEMFRSGNPQVLLSIITTGIVKVASAKQDSQALQRFSLP